MKTARVAWLRPIAFACLLLTTGSARAGSGTDYLIIENVDRLQIYNKYQQLATTEERRLLIPFTPMRIVSANDLLGDGFTHCMQVEVDGQTFFLLKDTDGHLGRSGSLGYERTFQNSVPVLDTVRILMDHSVRISPENARAEYFARSDLVLRIFRHGSRTYCRTLTGRPLYGWVDFTGNVNRKSWQVIERTAESTSLSPVTVHKIEMQIAEVNRVLVQLYEFFNGRTGQNKPVPQWSVEASSNTLLCTLQGEQDRGAFEQSTFYLVNEIENTVLGSAFRVTHSPGSIEIQSR